MKMYRLLGFFCWFLTPVFLAGQQRIYSPNSVLSNGVWYKLSIKNQGVYKIDIPLLNSMGVNTTNLASNSLRLYGNGGQMLDESNNGNWIDDLKENAVFVEDGGDGVINGSDFILFYAQGPDEWLVDSVNRKFSHRKNLYSDKTFYFLNIGGTGKRILTSPPFTTPNIIVNTFSERIFHELDTINFLASGKEWYGEEFTNAPGKTLSRNFNVNIPGILNNSLVSIKSSLISRSAGTGSGFEIRINNQPSGQFTINPVPGGQYDLFAREISAETSVISSTGNVSINYTYIPGSFNSQGWLNWFELFTRRTIAMDGTDQLFFRDWQSVGSNTGEFIVGNASATTKIWDITDYFNPLNIQGNLNGNEFHFINDCSSLREYVAFNYTGLQYPAFETKINNQNLHNTLPVDYLIITYPAFLTQAQRLALLHQQKNNMRTLVVTTEQVYNEFAGGNPDPTAIRDFVKMYYDKYKNISADKLKYLLLLGSASYDYKNRISNNTNFVPAYQNNFSLDPLSTYTSDDYFGFLDDNENINSGTILNLLDIGIGRIPAKNIAEVKNFVDKAEMYLSPKSFGPWRNNITFIADDEDANLHLQAAEIISATAALTAPVFNQQKIYLDAFQQERDAGSSSFPQANQASNNQVYNGTLMWNYCGHGGAKRLAEENILDQAVADNWNNTDKLPLFITATCDFAPFDNPGINSLGDNILLRPKTGAIALMTTTRPVFAFSNRIINDNYIRVALELNANGVHRTLGDAVKDAKNFTYQTFGDISNNRKFTLLGDPALTLGFPQMKVKTTRVNSIPVSSADTLSSKEKITIDGEVTDLQGNLINDFNGNVYPVVFDKMQNVSTLGNDPTSQVTTFQTQSSILFKGKSSVVNGKFSFNFKVPVDINYQYGNGKLSLYAENGIKDANGYFNNFLIGGAISNTENDDAGPGIKVYLNDEKFINGGITNQNPILIVKLSDSSGINTSGNGIGHDLTATLDNDSRAFFILNEFYESELNSYQEGIARFQLPELKPGNHTLKIKAWDVLNNSNEAILDFTVTNDEELILSHVLNYPNPFTTKTSFWFEHNKPGQQLMVDLQIMTITGRVIKSINKIITTDGNRSDEINWDGKDDFGDRPGRGIYLYKLRVITSDKKKKEVIEKLVIL